PSRFPAGNLAVGYQIEGLPAVDGRLPSIWDSFNHTLGKSKDGPTGSIATELYVRWKEDIVLLRAYGVKAYRFSEILVRIIPHLEGIHVKRLV
ncbi:glycoside hydrolase superfamily, partial [Vararia minispora EC-137]